MKKYNLKFVLLLLISQVFFTITMAQSLSLKDYLKRVKTDNVELKISQQNTKNVKADYLIAKSAVLPSLSARANFQRDLNKTYLFINDENGNSQKLRTNFNNSIGTSLTLNQTVFNPMIFSAIKMVKLNQEAAELNHKSRLNLIKTNASILYWQAVLAKESAKVLLENSELAKFQFQQSKIFFKNGTISELGLHQSEIQYQKSIPIYKNAQNAYIKLMNDLKLVANISLLSEVHLTDSLHHFGLVSNVADNDGNVLLNTELLYLEKQKEIAENEVKARKKHWLPTLDLTVNYDYNAQANNFNFRTNKNNFLNANFGLNLPLYSGGKNKAEIDKAKITQEISQLNSIQSKEQLFTDLSHAKNNQALALENIKLLKTTIKLAYKELAIYNAQMKLGVISPIELKECRLRLIQSKLDILNAYLNLKISKLNINKLIHPQN